MTAEEKLQTAMALLLETVSTINPIDEEFGDCNYCKSDNHMLPHEHTADCLWIRVRDFLVAEYGPCGTSIEAEMDAWNRNPNIHLCGLHAGHTGPHYCRRCGVRWHRKDDMSQLLGPQCIGSRKANETLEMYVRVPTPERPVGQDGLPWVCPDHPDAYTLQDEHGNAWCRDCNRMLSRFVKE